MANMTSQTDRARQQGENAEQDGDEPSVAARAAAGASVLGQQQVRKAREQFEEQIASQRERVTGRVRTLSRALKGAGGMLEEDDLVAQCLHFASDKVEGVAGYVDEFTPTEAVEDLRGLARDRPAWFFGGAFVLGLALGRFARSTAGSMAESAEPQGRKMRARNTRGAAQRTGERSAASGGRSRSESPTRSGSSRS